MNKINYHLKYQETIKAIKGKPSLLLHVCCGPCFTIPYEELKDHFNLTLFFNNSNIYPQEEYQRRLDELKDYIDDVCPNINIIILPYNNELFNQKLEPHKDDKEGHERCRICFKARLEQAFKYASEHHFDFCGTVMTISRYKNAQDINQIGLELEKQYPMTKWLCADFKKNNGYEKSLIIIKEKGMYLQEYCGCKYSFRKK